MKNEKVSFQNTRVCPPKKMAPITAKWSIKIKHVFLKSELASLNWSMVDQ